MRLSEIRRELAGWAYYTGDIDPEVEVRVGDAKAPLTCMEVGDYAKREPIILGNWSHPWEVEDAGEEGQSQVSGSQCSSEDRGDW